MNNDSDLKLLNNLTNLNMQQIASSFNRYCLLNLLSTTGQIEYYISYLINISLVLLNYEKPINNNEIFGWIYIKKLVYVYKDYYFKEKLTLNQKQRLENEILLRFLREIFPEKKISKNFLRQRKKSSQEKMSYQEFLKICFK